MTPPIVLCLGRGQDSYGMALGMVERGIRPTLTLFADVGSEKRQTYEQAETFDAYLVQHGWDKPVTVRYKVKKFLHWPPYYTLLENCLTNVTLPSLAYGFHTCSSKWKIQAINAYINSLPWAQRVWAQRGKIDKLIGFDSSPHELRRAARGCQTFAIQTDEKDKYNLRFLLQEWGWTREDALAAIARHGLPVPPKSSCYFCPAMKPFEVDDLDPDELRVIIVLEARTRTRHLRRAEKEGWPKGEGVPLIDGLWRKPIKGCRGATPRPGSITVYIRQKGLLPAAEIDRIIAATPTGIFKRSDFDQLGFNSWQDWLDAIIFQKPSIDLTRYTTQPEEAKEELLQLSLL